eukprot:Skav222491  [mRNA]  locus=scaffold1835:172720:177369:- [translate_table: standard]
MGLPQWEQMLKESDVFAGFSAKSMTSKQHLLIEGKPTIHRGNVQVVKVLRPAGSPVMAAINDVMCWNEEELIGEFRLLWDLDTKIEVSSPKFWLLNVHISLDDAEEWDFRVSAGSTLLPIKDVDKNPLHVLECFAGGYGGWSYAMKHLRRHFGIPSQILSLESDLAACSNFAVNHQVPIVNGFNVLPHDTFQDVHEDCLLHADVASRDWLGAVSTWHPHVMLVSSPCPPWSAAGEAKGLNTEAGMLLPETIIQAKWLQPEVIILEQVASIQQHQHKQHVHRTFHACGYIHVWTRIVDMQNCTPVARPRWLSVWRRADVDVDQSIQYRGFLEANLTPASFQAVLQPDMCPEGVYLTPEVRSMLSNPKMLPRSKRHKSCQDPLKTRTYTAQQQLPVFMASYGSQHHFDESRLKDYGCYAHVLEQEGQIRFWTPLEVGLLHFAIHAFFVPKSEVIAFRHLGNQISVPHAMIAICHALKKLGWYDLDMDSVHHSLKTCRLTVDNITVDVGLTGTMIVHDDVNMGMSEQKHQQVHLLLQLMGAMLPRDHWWDFEGLHELPLPKLQATVLDDESELASVPSSAPLVRPTLRDSGSISPCTDQAASESDSQDLQMISATLKFRPTLSLRVMFQHGTQTFWVSGDTSPQSLQQLWDRPMDVTCDQGVLKLTPLNAAHHLISDDLFAVCIVDRRLTIYQLENLDEKISRADELFQEWGITSGYDAHGKIPGDALIKFHLLVSDRPIEPPKTQVALPFVVAAFHSTHVLFDYHSQDDSWNVIITGDATARETIANLYAASLTSDTLKQLGRTVQIFRKDNHAVVVFAPAYQQTALPPVMFAKCVALNVAKILLEQTAVPFGIPVKFKWEGRVFWEGLMDPNMEAQSLCSLLQVGLAPVTQFKNLRCVAAAKNFASGLLRDIAVPARHTIFHVFHEMAGGAGPESSKQKLKQQIRNALASALLEQGIDLKWIQDNMETIIHHAGVGKLMPILTGPSSIQKDNQIRQTIHDCNLVLPNKPKTGSVAPSVLRTKGKRRNVAVPHPSDYTLDCSVLTNEDGSPVTQIQSFGGNMTGAFLADAHTSLPWIRASQQVSPDELVMIVIGGLPCPSTLPHKDIVIPCKDPNQHPVLMQATMIQFGAKEVSYQALDKKEFQHAASKVVAFTMWKTDWTDAEWSQLLSNTGMFLKQKFQSTDGTETILSSWGRSLRCGRGPGTIHDATSVQVHAAIPPNALLLVLQLSGYNKIWASPKNEAGRVSDDFRVIWMSPQDDAQQLSVKTATLSGVAGLIKGKASLGVRIQSHRFDAAWAALKPSDPKPSNIKTTHVYKLEPLPYGCSPKALTEWGEYVGWSIKPLRASGPRAWIVGAEMQAPQKQLVFNSQLVLPTLLPPKQSNFRSPILAGPRAKPQTRELTPANVQSSDPWASYVGVNGSTGITPPAPAQPARSVVGPTEQKFQEQDAKLQELEQKLTMVCTRQDENSAQIHQVHQSVTSMENRLSNQVQQSMANMKQELTSSLAETIKQQSKSFDDSLQQLSQLFKQSKSKRKSKDGKGADEDDDMSSS